MLHASKSEERDQDLTESTGVWSENSGAIQRLKKPREQMQYILATDVGSTTTKARFFAKRSGEWRFVASGEAPTTVESPYEDVTMGVRNAVREVEELTQHRIMSEDGSGILVPFNGVRGVDLYCTTSSAGGGLQMMVFGIMETMTAASARKAALGAGAIVMDVVATSDGRPEFIKMMILIASCITRGHGQPVQVLIHETQCEDGSARQQLNR